jgi:DNA-binding transcriptional regulator WhiA
MKNGEIIPKVLNSIGAKDRWLNIEEFGSRRGVNSEENRLRQLGFTPPKR